MVYTFNTLSESSHLLTTKGLERYQLACFLELPVNVATQASLNKTGVF